MFETIWPQLDDFIAGRMATANAPGMALALTDRAGTLRVTGYGLASRETDAPVTPDTLFEIGSIGKGFTALALLQLVEVGQLDLHTPITKILPWFSVRSQYAPITLHHLLSHTAGIILGTDFSGEPRYEAYALRETETGSPPGTYFHYSNVGYKLLGCLLEDQLRQPYAHIIRERILRPLGMDATEPVITNDIRHRLAVGYEAYCDDRPYPPERPQAPATWLETNTGDGCLAATASDMAAYLRMLTNRGHPGVLSSSAFALMSQKIVPAFDDPNMFYGYGLTRNHDQGLDLIGHGGGMVGYWSCLLADEDSGLGAVVLTNGRYLDTYEIALTAIRLLRAAARGEATPQLAPVKDPTHIENAADFAGVYRGGDRSLTLRADGNRLLLEHAGQAVTLIQRQPDRFYVPHPDFDRFLLEFGRAGEAVVEVFYGGDWYVHERYSGPTHFETPPEWRALVGHYRSFNPWFSSFRMIPRKDGLRMVFRGTTFELLTPLPDGSFRIGKDAQSPERLRFDTLMDGRTLRAFYSGAPYYRFFTP